jgi:hypothetical protein
LVRIAYCVLAHKNAIQVDRLLNNIYSGEDLFYVNVFNGESSKTDWKKRVGTHRIHLNFKYGQSWGQFPVVSATLDAMQKVSNSSYDYFVNLSGQCYPIKSNVAIKQFFRGKKNAFIEIEKLPSPLWGQMGGLDRIVFSYYKHPIRIVRYYILNSILGYELAESKRFFRLPRLKKRLPYNLELYGGSAYFCITKKHVDYILEYVKNNPELIKFFRRSFAPDETFFQTILVNSELKETIVNNNLRYIVWSGKGRKWAPVVFTIKDAEKLMSYPALYARKFDIKRDKAILDLIDRYRATELNATAFAN